MKIFTDGIIPKELESRYARLNKDQIDYNKWLKNLATDHQITVDELIHLPNEVLEPSRKLFMILQPPIIRDTAIAEIACMYATKVQEILESTEVLNRTAIEARIQYEQGNLSASNLKELGFLCNTMANLCHNIGAAKDSIAARAASFACALDNTVAYSVTCLYIMAATMSNPKIAEFDTMEQCIDELSKTNKMYNLGLS